MEAWGPADVAASRLRRATQAVGPRWTVDPPQAACEAAGLEVAVRAWWRGVPGRARRGRRSEDAWLRAAVAGGAGGKARARLQRLGIPGFVVEGGLQLGQFLQQDSEARQIWWGCQQEEDRQSFCRAVGKQEEGCQAAWIAHVVEQVFKRYDVRAEAWLAQEHGLGHPCLILAPHSPSAPSTPRPPPSAASARRPAARRLSRRDAAASSACPTPAPAGEVPLAGPGPRQQGARTPGPASPQQRSLEATRDLRTPGPGSPQQRPSDAELLRKESDEQKAWAASFSSSGRASASTRAPTASETPAMFLDTPLEPLEETLCRGTFDSPAHSSGAGTPAHATPRQAHFSPRSGRGSVPPPCDIAGPAEPMRLELPPKRAASAMAKMVRHAKTAHSMAEPASPQPSLTSRQRSEGLHLPAGACPRRMGSKPRRAGSKEKSAPASPTGANTLSTPLVRAARRARTVTPKMCESNFDRWMLNVKRSITQQKEMEDNQLVVKECKQYEKPPLLQHGSSKAAQRVIRDIEQVAGIFKHFDVDHSGVIEPHEFVPLLSKLMQQPACELDTLEVWKTWDAVDVDGSGVISYEEFHTWYCSAFEVEKVTDFRDFFSDANVSEDQKHMREVASKLGIDYVEIEKIWKEFHHIDADSSGLIDYDEFKVLIQQQISPAPESPEVPAKVVDKFWMDVDSDNSGSISFEEFAAWYLKFLRGEISPMEKYYQMVGTGFRRALAWSMRDPSHS